MTATDDKRLTTEMFLNLTFTWAEKKGKKVDRDVKPTKADILSWMKSHRIETKQYRIESSQVEVKDTAARPTESKSSD